MDSVVDSQDDNPAIVLARERPFRLGAVEVRPGTREVTGPRGREVLEPRVMQVLVALARARGEVVTRDDLIASCWDGRAVGEDAITRVISRLRRLSEGLGRESWTLETITKVGYRLLPAGQAAEPLAAAAPQTQAAPTRRRAMIAVGAAAAVASAAGGIGVWRMRAPRPSARARALYERGRDALGQGSPADTAQAVGFLKEAVADSPRYAAAWGALGLAYQASLGFTEPSRQQGVYQQAVAAAERAQQLDANDPDAAATLALLSRGYGEWATAERRLIEALRLHPREPRLEVAYARLLLEVGRHRDAVSAAELAVAGDSLSAWYHHALATALWGVGRIEEAERTVRKALALWPRHHALWFRLFYLLAHSGRAAEAASRAGELAAAPDGIPPEDLELSLQAARAMASREPAAIEAVIRTQWDAAHRGIGYAENAIDWLSALGRVDDAFRVARAMYLDEGFAIGPQRFSPEQGRFAFGGRRITLLLFLPPTAPMRRDPRFGPLVRDIGLVRYWKQSGRMPDDRAWTWGLV